MKRQRDTVFSINAGNQDKNIGSAILEMADRRPVTIEDMAAGLGMPVEKIRKQVKSLIADNRLEELKQNTATYYRTNTFHAES